MGIGSVAAWGVTRLLSSDLMKCSSSAVNREGSFCNKMAKRAAEQCSSGKECEDANQHGANGAAVGPSVRENNAWASTNAANFAGSISAGRYRYSDKDQ